MAKLLHLQASIRGDRSYSIRVARTFLESYREAHPDDVIETLDFADDDAVMPFRRVAVDAKYHVLHGDSPTDDQIATWKQVEAAIEQFKSADKLLISAPMWNFGVPYHLKQYFDVIVQPGYTFNYDPDHGYTGLVTGRPAMLILARGGTYAPGTPTESYDMQMPYLQLILGFVGFKRILTLPIEPTLMSGPETAQRMLERAQEHARDKAKTF